MTDNKKDKQHILCQTLKKEEMKQTLLIDFSTQKGGVGKTTFTTLAASYLHYLSGYNVAVMDCDYPQWSVHSLRKREAEQLQSNGF
jgi:cellulose biosynthesis protein BcsQ